MTTHRLTRQLTEFKLDRIDNQLYLMARFQGVWLCFGPVPDNLDPKAIRVRLVLELTDITVPSNANP